MGCLPQYWDSLQVTDQKRPEARGKIRENGLVPAWQAQRALLLAEARPLERKIHLTAALVGDVVHMSVSHNLLCEAGDLMDELAAAYGFGPSLCPSVQKLMLATKARSGSRTPGVLTCDIRVRAVVRSGCESAPEILGTSDRCS